MTTDSGLLLLRTSIRPEMKRHVLFQSCTIAAGSLLVIWFADILLPLAGIESLGIWRWLASGGVLGASYLPYGSLRKQQTYPDLLQVTDHELRLIQNSAIVFRLSWNQIESFSFLDRGSIYGLAFKLQTTAEIPQKMYQSVENEEQLNKSLERLLHSQDDLQQGVPSCPTSPYKHFESVETKQTAPIPAELIQKSRKEYGVDLFLPFILM